jgi:hypothetical protein
MLGLRVRALRLALCVVGLVFGIALLVASGAFASWLATVTSGTTNFPAATAQTLPTGATPTTTVSPAANPTVTITFAQTSTSGSTPVTAYNVNRYAQGSSSSTSISGSCGITASIVTCTDTPGAGTWQYTDVPTIASSNWTGTESAKSTAVVVQALPTLSVGATASIVANAGVTPSGTLAGATTSPAPGGSVSFSVFGPQATAPTTCTGTGWSTVGTAVTVTANGAYNASAAFTPITAGTYWWHASYSGDIHNSAANSPCQPITSTMVHLAVSPSSLPAATVYTAYSQTITASAGTSPYTFAVTSGSLPTGLTLSSGGVLSGTINTSGQVGSYGFTVTATDHAGLTGTQVYSLVVNPPTITVSPSTLPAAAVYTAYSQTLSSSGGVSAYTYGETGALPTGITLSTSGVFSGTINTAGQSGSYPVTVTTTDAHGYTGTQAYTLGVSATITLSPSSLPPATVYTAYSQTLTSAGGSGTYSYAELGALPTGITLTTGGVLSGTINTSAQSGSYPITVTSTDNHAYTGTQAYTLVVNPPPIMLAPPTLTNPVGEATYSATISATGGQTAYTFAKTSGSLPTGLSLAPSTGMISGTESAPGTFAFTVTATDAHSYTGSRAYSVTVVGPTITISPSTLSAATVYAAYTKTFTSSGGLGTHTYTEAGALPAGLTLTSGGVLSGTISTSGQNGSYPITVTSTDVDGFTGSSSYTLVVNPPSIVVSPSSLPAATVYTAYSQTLTSAGGGGTYSYTETGALPTGITLTTGGVLAGTINTSGQSGSYPITVTSTDNHAYTGTQTYTLVVSAAITMSPASGLSTLGGVPYSQQITASGGMGPYTYAITSGALPSSLTLSSGGLISGTSPLTVLATYNFTITATDANGYTGSMAYSLFILL